MKKYETVMAYVDQLLAGGIKKLPAESELAAELNISRCPVRQALDQLEKDGRIITYPGVGRFVPGLEPVGVRRQKQLHRLIGVATYEMLSSTTPMLMGVQQKLLDAGFLISNLFDLPNYSTGGNTIAHLEDAVDGMLIAPPSELQISHPTLVDNLNAFRAKTGLHVVVLGRQLANYNGSRVVIDNASGSALAVEEILADGTTEIAYLGKNDYRVGIDRYAGYRRALNENNLEVDPSLVILDHSGVQFQQQLDALIAAELPPLLNRHPSCRNFVTFSYLMAHAAYCYCRKLGMPMEEFRFFGYDVEPGLSNDFYNRYTVIERPMEEIGRSGAAMLLELIESGRPNTDFLVRRVQPELRSAGLILKKLGIDTETKPVNQY
ncbi:MAG: GntR family transcriptional regulator [Victivallaceae bacterium]|nr:GntR family transcriptional regulator [Victivallaceae bacterium]